MKKQGWDILVVGAGPAGTSAALSAAQAGMRVLVVERKSVVGSPVRCAEYIPQPLLGDVQVGSDFVIQRVRGMRTVLPGGEEKTTPAPGFMIRRDLFDRALCEAAQAAGAGLMLSARVVSQEGERVVLKKRGGGRAEIRAHVIIGADGPHSTVGRWIGSVNRNLISALQVRVPLTTPMDCTEVHFQKAFYRGYGWLFPKGETANVGLGMKRNPGCGASLPTTLNRFVAQLTGEGKVRNEPLGITAGWIPAEPLRNMVTGRVMLAGDAAGQTHPITGAGVFQAVTGGRMAGRWAASAVEHGDLGLLHGYEEEWRDLFGESHGRAFRRRQLLEREWERLDEVVKSCWVAFREYYCE